MRQLVCLLFVIVAALPAAEPSRIVSTAPSLTEILYALGAGRRVVGVTQYCNYPPEARTKPQVGTFLQPDLERVLSLRPDLVLVVKNPIDLTAKLRGLGLNAHEFDQDSIAGILESVLRIGDLTGRREEARRLHERLRAELESIRSAVRGRRQRSVIFLVGRAPGTLQGMVGAGPGSFVDELLTLAGGRNVLAGTPLPYPRVSLETVLATDPEFILDMGDFAHAEGRPGQPEHEIIALWSKYGQLRAVRQRQVRVISIEALIRPGPRLVEGARELQRILHPETLR